MLFDDKVAKKTHQDYPINQTFGPKEFKKSNSEWYPSIQSKDACFFK